MGVFADRVKESTTTTGTGSITLNGTSTGYRTFNAAVGVGIRTYYTIAHQSADEWEVGEGYLSSSTVFVRDVVFSSTNAGALVNFSAGTKDIFVAVPAKEIKDNALNAAYRMAMVNN
jgi:hypothetical protein